MRPNFVAIMFALLGAVALSGCKGCSQPDKKKGKASAAASDSSGPDKPSKPSKPDKPSKPGDVETAVAAPSGKGDVATFGNHLAMATAPGGETTIAFQSYDPNMDGDTTDAAVFAVTSDRKNNAWGDPAKLATIGRYTDAHPHQLAIARDKDTIAVAYVMQDDSGMNVMLATSTDQGKSWKSAKVASGDRPSLALSNAQLDMTLVSDAPRHLSGAVTADPTSWKSEELPTDQGAFHGGGAPVVAHDDQGKPAIAWGASAEAGGINIVFWRPGQAAVVAMTSGGTQNDSFDVQLAFHRDQPYAAFVGVVGDESAHFVSKSSDGGATWSPRAIVPNDGGQNVGGPSSFAMSASGEGVLTAPVSGGNTTGTKCSLPKVSRAKGFDGWSTCSPIAEKPIGGGWPVVNFDGDKLIVAVTNQDPEARPVGIYVWREP